MSILITSPETEKDYLEYFQFRWKMLREPHGKSFGSEKDALEDTSHHVRLIIDPKKIIGVGRIHFIKDENKYKKGQIRYMAIHNDYQKNGYGTKILNALEIHAKNNSVHNIFLNSRQSALGFYENNGYKILKKSHLLFNEIQHWKMEKTII